MMRHILRFGAIGFLGLAAACTAVEETGEAGTTVLLRETPFVLQPVPSDVPADFTGCYEEALACYVGGQLTEAALRYEPQSGRYWFLDATSGNTYFANGDLRTAADPDAAAALSDGVGAYETPARLPRLKDLGTSN